MDAASRGQFMRFLLVGSFNTIGGYLLYFLCLWLGASPTIAYSIAWIISVSWAYALNSKFTFRVAFSARKFFAFPLIYVLQYWLGLAILHLALRLGVIPELAPIPAIVVTIPVTFLLMRLLLKSAKI